MIGLKIGVSRNGAMIGLFDDCNADGVDDCNVRWLNKGKLGNGAGLMWLLRIKIFLH